jgi:hypothetical protein
MKHTEKYMYIMYHLKKKLKQQKKETIVIIINASIY